jgi:hypothetical protein
VTTTIELDAYTLTIGEVCEAIRHAQDTKKRLILRGQAAHLPAIEARIKALVAQWEALLDAQDEPEQRPDNSAYVTQGNYNPSDIGHGFHVTRRGSH